jgi:hypothetical protein
VANRLGRQSRNEQSSVKYIPYLDGWRRLAICFLLLGHFFPVPGINFGTAGVNLFFVLSGFLTARILFGIDTDFNVLRMLCGRHISGCDLLHRRRAGCLAGVGEADQLDRDSSGGRIHQ